MKKPNLFVVGEQKTGTTTIHDYLDQHPQVFMSRPKEHLFFAQDLIKIANRRNGGWLNKTSKSIENYLQLFPNSGKYKYEGESGTHYSHSDLAA